MADIADILTIDDAETFAFDQLGEFLYEVIPHRKLVLDSSTITAGTTPYLVADILTNTSYSEGLGQKPVLSNLASDGTSTKIYKDKLTIDLRAYLGEARKDLNLVRTKLNNSDLKFKHFGSTKGLVAITDIGNVLDNKVTVYESQETANGAILRIGLSYIYKEVEAVYYVETINISSDVTSNEDTIENTSEVTGV